MRVRRFTDPEAFLARAGSFFKSDPFSPNVIATVTTRIVSGVLPIGEDHVWLSVEGDDAQVLGLAMHTPPHHMFLSRMPSEAALVLAREMADSGKNLPGVNGVIASTGAFAAAWGQFAGRSSRLVKETRMYLLADLRWPEAVPGQARRAEISRDLGLTAEWFAAFHEEAQSHSPDDDWTAMARRRMEAQELHLWLADGVPVALAGVSQAVAGVARVGPVYTPHQWRGNGYGSGVTAAATSAGLDAGAQHVVLYTDLANPISNSIYQKIGYRADHDAEERAFVDEQDPCSIWGPRPHPSHPAARMPP
jgi:RimJ/RimL family protein N-acetyltransferase